MSDGQKRNAARHKPLAFGSNTTTGGGLNASSEYQPAPKGHTYAVVTVRLAATKQTGVTLALKTAGGKTSKRHSEMFGAWSSGGTVTEYVHPGRDYALRALWIVEDGKLDGATLVVNKTAYPITRCDR